MSCQNHQPASACLTANRRHILSLSTSVIALALAGALSAAVLGAETTIPSGTTVGQQLLNPGDKLSIEAGGKVTDNATPIYANNTPGNYTVVNKGTIEIANGNSISLDNLDLDNSGMIISTAGGGILVSGTSKIVNSGTISGHDAIHASSQILSLTNAAGGTIIGDEYAVQATTVGLIDNAGLLDGGYIALTLGSLGTLNNSATGVITNHTLTQAAISISGSAGNINNAGRIDGQKIGIEVGGDLGALNNSGHITVTDSVTGIAVFANSIGSVDNSGTIGGGDIGVYSNTVGSITNSNTIYGETNAINAATIGTLVNSGELTSGDATVYSTDTIGTLTNTKTGSITSTGYYGVRGKDVGSIVNEGIISGTRFGFYGDGALGSLNNSGTMTGSDYAAAADSIGTIINSGLLESNEAALFSYGYIASITNTATGQMLAKFGIESQANIGSVANAGLIAGDLGSGISAVQLGSLSNTRTGLITGGFFGIGSDTTIGSIINDGQIIGADRGISAGTGIASISNTGLIDATDLVGAGILIASGDLGDLRNSGTIAGETTAIYLNGDIGNLRNAGTIEGRSSSGIAGSGTIVNLNNTGTIRGVNNGINYFGINALTNSGLISAAGPGGNAIVEYGAAATDTLLTLNAGSVLIGHVDIHGGTNTLNVGNGLNLALTFDTSVPELIETNGSAYTVIGNTVYVADMDAFAAAGVATSELTGAIGAAAGAALDEGFDEKGLDGQGHFWLQAIGGLGYDGATDMDLRYGGLVAGADFGPDAVTRFGAFGGGSRGAVGGASAVSSFYAGVYGAGQFEDFSIKGSLTGGATEADTDRWVANNTLATGIEAASSTQDAYFISPSLTITRPWQTQDFSFETSLGLSYTGVFGQDFTENLATGLTVDGYGTHVFEAEGLIRLPFQTVLDGGTLTGDTHAGIEARAVVAPDITGTLAGAAMTLASANTQATAGAVAGASLTYNLAGGASIFGGIDGTIRSDESAVLAANAGIKAEF